MRALLQRVSRGSVDIEGATAGQIDKGYVIFLGIGESDGESECEYIVEKILNLRVFKDENGKLNKSLIDINGKALIISQFTLYANCKHGRRPSFIEAAKPDKAIPLYEKFVEIFKNTGVEVQTGEFGAQMSVLIENDGPVTIWLDTEDIMPKNKEA